MAPPKPALKAADLITFFIAGIFGIVAGNLTYLALYANRDLFLEPLRPALMPGFFLAWLLTGDKNGDLTVQGAAPFIAVFVNAIVYACVIMVPRLLWCHVTRTPPTPSQLSPTEEPD